MACVKDAKKSTHLLINIYCSSIKYVTHSAETFQVEAWPEPVLAWEFRGVTCCTEGLRYKMETILTPLKFRFIMRLEIHDITQRDIGRYSCVAKNEMNNQTVRSNIELKCK